jgi:predicted nucleotide-binding protein (sugar kinase/HSP70/actin superfamily)
MTQAGDRGPERPRETSLSALKGSGVTILFSGLTEAHERLVEGAWEGLGYRAKALPVPDNEALALGREYCNRGMCNPAYYTVGNLLKHLLRLRRAGVPDIEERFVYLTAGSCGPCRFGMYENEYRRALAQAGFPRFPILLIQQAHGLQQVDDGGTGVIERAFLLALIRALMLGDQLNEIGHALRPYEREPGSVDAALGEGRRWLYWTLRGRENPVPVLRRLRRRLDELPMDYLRVKPKVKVTGEFWAQTTEGDGSYHLARWLEEQGAEVLVEPVGTWIEYLLWTRLRRARDRRGLPQEGREPHTPALEVRLKIGQVLFDSVYNAYRAALGFRPEPLASLDSLARYAHDYYNTRIGGGEAFLEVAKTIFAVRRRRAHMIVSIKPFGCMPSTQSDGVQVRVLADHPDALFVTVETSGDSEVHVKSRVQMILSEARQRAREEFARTAEHLGLAEALAEGGRAAAWPVPAAATPLPRHAVSTAAAYLWWLRRPAGLRSLPLPSERIGELLVRRRRPPDSG